MKSSISENGFRLIGKGWQIRAHLRQLSQHPITVAEYLDRQQAPPNIKILSKKRLPKRAP